ncbi:YkuS family protein [Crassaminicella indica]|uniref:YkuS family protein n=1 Tax=Crassaminicella indica TaxID=2855394 RepID=A0ABX8RFR2_9CLOT|nr:YkuS family protein [Crassaminicella indica]QXM05781.1 YkuS family protein [Crassaminicella indica]
MRKVAVEKSLENVKSYLNYKGYDVADLEGTKSNLKSFDAIVVSGQNSNMLGMHDTNTRASVINAKGMTPEDVHAQIENRLS